MKVLVIQPDGYGDTSEITGPEAGRLAQFQAHVGGFIEAIGGAGWAAYVNEDGRMRGLPPNYAATRLAAALGWPGNTTLLGPAVFFGRGTGPDEKDVPARVLDAWAGRRLS